MRRLELRSATKRYTAGLAIELRLPARLSLEVDGLYFPGTSGGVLLTSASVAARVGVMLAGGLEFHAGPMRVTFLLGLMF